MTREQAIDAYYDAIDHFNSEDPASKNRVRAAREALMPFLERTNDPRTTNGALPMDLRQRFKNRQEGQ